MGGRGASSGMSEKGKPYGSEFRTLLKAGNVKFVKQNKVQKCILRHFCLLGDL